MKKTIFLLLLTLAISACSAKGPTYHANQASMKAPGATMSQIIIYRPDQFVYSMRQPGVEINGMKSCDLPNNSFFIRDIAAQQTTVSASLWDMPGTSRLTFTPQAGGRYYIRIAPDGGKMAAGMIGGIVGTFAAEGYSENAGPFAISLLDEQTAGTEITFLKMTTECH